MDVANKTTDQAMVNWSRYLYLIGTGHALYVENAAINEQFYLGGGAQWDEDSRVRLGGRLPVEFNEIMPAVNSALGYQIHNRMGIGFMPRGGEADEKNAEILNKVVRQIADANKLPWVETQVWADGLIEGRGYFDVRMDYEKNALGEIRITDLDPRDVIPDPDGKHYDPATWADVMVTRWMTEDEIRQVFGDEAGAKVSSKGPYGDSDYGQDGMDGPRNRFGYHAGWGSYDGGTAKIPRWRVLDRQRWEMALTPCAIYPTGEIEPVEGAAPERLEELQGQGCVIEKRMRKRVRWTVTTMTEVLHDEISPYPFFTIVPFFPIFRRGKTRGLVDNGVSPQKALNVAMTQEVAVLSTSANSGWLVEENALTTMRTDDLEAFGAKPGLVVEYRRGSTPPQRIQPTPVPTGIDRIIDRATQAVRDATIPEAMRGIAGPDQAGVAIQSSQFASQQQMAIMLDNLAKTRHMLAEKILWLVQNYYTAQRLFRITETDPRTGKDSSVPLVVNQFDPATGGYLNDLTEGDYDVVITEQPLQVTFENSQFNQALEMRKAGLAVPDSAVIRHSNLADKHEVLQQMADASQGGGAAEQAEAELTKAKAEKLQAETTQIRLESQFSGVQTAQIIAQTPDTAALGDVLLRSAGYQDQDAPPLLPTPEAGLHTVQVPENTHPLMPAHPQEGLLRGFETNRE